MASTAGLASGTTQPRTAHAQLTGTLSPRQVPSREKQGPAHSTGMRQHSRGYNTSSLHPLPVKMPDTFRLRTHGSNMPLCDLNLCNTHSSPCITGLTSPTRYRSEPTHASRFCFLFDASWGKCHLWCQLEWHCAQSTQA